MAFFVDLQVAEDNFDDPNLLDFDLLLKNMTEIQSGCATQTPVYSFSESKRVGFVTTPVPQSKVLIVEGTYALKEMLRPVYDMAISVTGAPYCSCFKCLYFTHRCTRVIGFSDFSDIAYLAGGVHFDLVKRVLRDITRVSVQMLWIHLVF